MPESVRDMAIPYPVAVDTRGETEKAYFVDSYPDYFLIDRSGKLRIADLMHHELERAIAYLLKEEIPHNPGIQPDLR